MTSEYDIAVMLPTRGGSQSLTNSIQSIITTARTLDRIVFVFALDRDDTDGIEYFQNTMSEWLDSKDINYSAILFNRLGYTAINEYYNHMASQVSADWYFIWNDDAVMNTKAWDDVIRQCNGEFKLLKVHTHRDHPYSIFPIVPHKWLELLGYLSRHQMIDAELSQAAYMLDIMKIVEIDVTHDVNAQVKTRFEGNPKDPRDFHYIDNHNQRIKDCVKLANHMKSIGMSTEFFENVLASKQDPWERLVEYDVNNQMRQFNMSVPKNIMADIKVG
jgi:hypothetical protein